MKDVAGEETIGANSDGILRARQVIANEITAVSDGIRAGVKNFAVPHPERPGYAIVYSSLEGPEPGIFVRGTLRLKRGRGEARLPAHFRSLARPRSLTCNLTPRSSRSRGLAVASLSGRRLVVRELDGGKGAYRVDYVVFGKRRDVGAFRVVRRANGRDERSRGVTAAARPVGG